MSQPRRSSSSKAACTARGRQHEQAGIVRPVGDGGVQRGRGLEARQQGRDRHVADPRHLLAGVLVDGPVGSDELGAGPHQHLARLHAAGEAERLVRRPSRDVVRGVWHRHSSARPERLVGESLFAPIPLLRGALVRSLHAEFEALVAREQPAAPPWFPQGRVHDGSGVIAGRERLLDALAGERVDRRHRVADRQPTVVGGPASPGRSRVRGVQHPGADEAGRRPLRRCERAGQQRGPADACHFDGVEQRGRTSQPLVRRIGPDPTVRHGFDHGRTTIPGRRLADACERQRARPRRHHGNSSAGRPAGGHHDDLRAPRSVCAPPSLEHEAAAVAVLDHAGVFEHGDATFPGERAQAAIERTAPQQQPRCPIVAPHQLWRAPTGAVAQRIDLRGCAEFRPEAEAIEPGARGSEHRLERTARMQRAGVDQRDGVSRGREASCGHDPGGSPADHEHRGFGVRHGTQGPVRPTWQEDRCMAGPC